MATFLLVHGAWHGGWCWKYVRQKLTSAGHQVFTPSLSGLAEHFHHAGDYDLNTHIRDVVDLMIWEDLSDVILCGHSYGGMVISGVAARAAGRLASLVYLDAFIPEDDQSAMDIMGPEHGDNYRQRAAAREDGRMPPVKASVFGIEDAMEAAWIDSKCVPMNISCFETRLAHNGMGDVARKVAIAARDHPSPHFRQAADRWKGAPGWQTHIFPCAHEIMIQMPKELAGLLIKEAEALRSRS